MAKKKSQPNILFGIKGRNGFDPLFEIPESQCLEAFNVNWFRSSLGRKRNGSSSVATTGGTAVSNGLLSLIRHVPGTDETAQELWSADNVRFHRLAGGTAWADIAMLYGDALVNTSAPRANGATLNGKLYMACDPGVNRSYVWDGTTFRRTGLATSAAPSVADQGGGAYAATARNYKIGWTVQVSSVTVRRSELSPATAFTPSGANGAARVTKPTTPEDATHWEVWGSYAGVYHLLGTTAIGTTTFDDSTNPSAYTGDTAPAIGAYLTPPAYKFAVADDARLIMAGAYYTATSASYQTPPKNNRVWWTSITNATSIGDDERVSIVESGIRNYDDVEYAITGITPPIQGEFFVFSWAAMWKFSPTGDINNPYLKIRVTDGQGCVDHKSIVVAEDENGEPAVYWMSARGPMRAGRNGVQYIGRDVEDIWQTANLNMTLGTTSYNALAHAVWHPAIHQVWFYVACAPTGYGLSTPTKPTVKLVFDPQISRTTNYGEMARHGWSVDYWRSTYLAQCSCMFSETIGAAMSRSLKPYVGFYGVTTATDCLSKADIGGTEWNHFATPPAAETYPAYLDSKVLTPWGLGAQGGVIDSPVLVADVATGVTIYMSLVKNELAEHPKFSVSLTAVSDGGIETKVFPQFEGARLAQANSLRIHIGDDYFFQVSEGTPPYNSTPWNLDALVIPTDYEGPR